MLQKIAVVTGGTSGIGKALTKKLLEKNYRIITISRRHYDWNNENIEHFECDITKEEELKKISKYIINKHEKIDILFSNAGFGISGAVESCSMEQIKKQFDVNFFSSVSIIKKFLPAIKKSKGRILITSSVGGVIPIPFQVFYSCTKASLNQLALALNNELKGQGVKVIAVMPGDVSTSFTTNREKEISKDPIYLNREKKSVIKMESDEKKGKSSDWVAKRYIKIAEKKYPKPMYGLGLDYKIFLCLYKFLPIRFSNWIVGLIYAN